MLHPHVAVAIIGGGPGGLALAQGLKKHGIGVAVFEKDRARTDYVQGFRLGIRQRGLDALRLCLPEELYEAVLATAGRAPPTTLVVDETLALAAGHGWGSAADDLQVGLSVSRITLRQILLRGLEDELQVGPVFASYEENADGTVTARFEDGSAVTCNLLVGADGAGSRVRRQMLPEAGGFDTGVRRLAGKMTLEAAAHHRIPPLLLDNTVFVRPKRGHSLHVTAHRVVPEAYRRFGLIGSDDETHRGLGGFHFNNTTSYVWWNTAYRPGELGADAELAKLDGAGLLRLVLDRMPGWHADLRRLVELSDPSTVGLLRVRSSEPPPPWPAGRVTLLGDAIHAMTYFRALGGNTALYDAGLLTRALIAVARGETALLPAIAGYEEAMRAHGYDAVRTSLVNMERALGEPAQAAA